MSGLSFGMDMSMNMGGGFNPFAFGQPIVLLDAAKGITLNGADVSGWADQSGNGNDLTQATAVDQPLFNASDSNFNNNPSITFDGVTEFLSRLDTVSLSITGDLTYLAVIRRAAAASDGHIISKNSGAYRCRINSTGALWLLGNDGGGNENDTSALTLADDTTGIVVGQIDFTGDQFIHHLNGGTADTAAHTLTGLADTADSFDVGRLQSGAEFHDGEIAYILLYASLLSDTALNYNGNGLAARFGTTWTNI